MELKKIKEERIKNAEHNLEIDNLIKKKQIEEKVIILFIVSKKLKN